MSTTGTGPADTGPNAISLLGDDGAPAVSASPGWPEDSAATTPADCSAAATAASDGGGEGVRSTTLRSVSATAVGGSTGTSSALLTGTGLAETTANALPPPANAGLCEVPASPGGAIIGASTTPADCSATSVTSSDGGDAGAGPSTVRSASATRAGACVATSSALLTGAMLAEIGPTAMTGPDGASACAVSASPGAAVVDATRVPAPCSGTAAV